MTVKSQRIAWWLLIFANLWIFYTRFVPILHDSHLGFTCGENYNEPHIKIPTLVQFQGEKKKNTFNVTAKNANLLLYNALPVSGSPRLRKLITEMGDKHGFRVEQPLIFPPYFEPELTEDAIAQLELKSTEYANSSWAYVKEMHFYNVSSFRTNVMPVYVSMIRDPVERLISDFYRKRHGAWPLSYFMDKLKNNFSSWRDKDWNTCISQNDPECPVRKDQFNNFLNIPLLCGHYANCNVVGSDWAFKKAKENVLKNYAVVGVAELWEHTLIVLQHYVPRFFVDAYKHYAERHRMSDVVFSEWYFYKNASQSVRQYVRAQLPLEMEFYDFVRQTLWDKYEAIFLHFLGIKTQ